MGIGLRAAVAWLAKRIAVLRCGIDRWVLLHSAFAVVSGVLLVATIVHQDWIEALFGFDPDHYSGATEWAVTVLIVIATLWFAMRARARWRRVAAAE